MSTPSQLLLAAIRDPHDPRLCASCLIGCLEKIFPVRGIANTQAKSHSGASKRNNNSILADNHDVWNALILFITTKRTNKQMERLLVRLAVCKCHVTDTHIKELHRVGDNAGDDLIGENLLELEAMHPSMIGSAFIRYIFSLLLRALPSAGVKSVAKGLSTWPASPSDLIPLGAETFVTAMLQWEKMIDDTTAFAVLGHVLRLCRGLLIPSLVSQSVTGRLVEAGRSLFDRYLVYFKSNERDSLRGQHAADVFERQIDMIELFIAEVRDQKVDLSTALVRGSETKFCQLCALLVHVTTDPRFPKQSLNQHRVLIYWGQHLYRFYHMHLPPRPLIPLHPEMVTLDKIRFPPPASRRSLPETANFVIKWYRSDTRCSGLNCENTIQSVGRNFQRCGRCKIVGYCSRQCQKQDWNNPQYPHKEICPIFVDLVEKGGGWTVFSKSNDAKHPDVQTILRNWAAVGVKEADLQYVDDWLKDRELRRTQLPDGTEWTPGFDDYDTLIWQFSGRKPEYPDRLQRWPSEVAKVKAIFEVMPFWDQDIDI